MAAVAHAKNDHRPLEPGLIESNDCRRRSGRACSSRSPLAYPRLIILRLRDVAASRHLARETRTIEKREDRASQLVWLVLLQEMARAADRNVLDVMRSRDPLDEGALAPARDRVAIGKRAEHRFLARLQHAPSRAVVFRRGIVGMNRHEHRKLARTRDVRLIGKRCVVRGRDLGSKSRRTRPAHEETGRKYRHALRRFAPRLECLAATLLAR